MSTSESSHSGFNNKLTKNANKLIDCIVHLFPVYVWFSGKRGGGGGRLLDGGRLLERGV